MKRQTWAGRRGSGIKDGRYVEDFYTSKAKREGYKARSVLKLSEIDSRFGLFAPGMKVLDLGAAPGSWSQYAVEHSRGGRVVAVDLKDLDPALLPSLTYYKGDFRSRELQSGLRALGPYNLILSDMAWNTTGNRLVDTGRSLSMIEEVVSLLPELLGAGGSLLFKIFQSGGEESLASELRRDFRSFQRIRPKTVRSQSFEIYYLFRHYSGVSDPID